MQKLTETEITKKLKDLQDWEHHENHLQTSFEFENFKDAFSAMTRIAFEAESQGHHPDWSNVYNKLEISLSTHDAGGITEKDFKLAQTIDKIIETN